MMIRLRVINLLTSRKLIFHRFQKRKFSVFSGVYFIKLFNIAKNPSVETVRHLSFENQPNLSSTARSREWWQISDKYSSMPDINANEEIDFGNHEMAFKDKTAWEILRAFVILKVCGVETIVNRSLSIMDCAQRVSPYLFRSIMRPSAYEQFVGGENPEEMLCKMRQLTQCGSRAMLAATMEEDLGQGKGESLYDSNCNRILECIDFSSAEAACEPMMQIKISGILSADLLVFLGELYTSTEDKAKLIKTVASGISSETTYATSMPSYFNDNKQKSSFVKALSRLKKIGERAQARGIKILVDAEYTYFNPGLSLLTLALTDAYNRDSPLIWNTYQCYLKDARKKLQEELYLTHKLNVCFGAKVVRGAYMVQEKARAKLLNMADPVCENYEKTNENYNSIVNFLLYYTKEAKPKCQFIVATHNEESIKRTISTMKTLNIDRCKGNVFFGQLYGMCDQITYTLVKNGYVVYKSIPYGTLEEVLPYLARRAIENSSIFEGARKEQNLLWKEMKRRIRKRCRFS